MENNIDRLFQEGLSDDKIEDLSLYNDEKTQWKVVRSQLRNEKNRWGFVKFLPLLLLVGAAGAVLYLHYSIPDTTIPLASDEKIFSNSSEEEAIRANIKGENNNFESDPKTEQENTIVEGLSEIENQASERLKAGAKIAVPEIVKSTKIKDAVENSRPHEREQEFSSAEKIKMDSEEDVVMTNNSSVEASSYSSNEKGIAPSDPPSFYGSSSNYYGEKPKETLANYDYTSTKESTKIVLADEGERTNYPDSEIASIEVEKMDYKSAWKWSIVPEGFYHPTSSWWKNLNRGFSLRIGVDAPIHFNHAQVTRSGFGYDFGTDFNLTNRWGISADYIYQKLDRELLSELNSYNFPFKSDLYQDVEPVSSRYSYTSHTVLVGIRYRFYTGHRLHVGFNPAIEISGRGVAQGEFIYEGPYQQEKENFEFESKLISANSLSLGIIAEYKLFVRLNLVGRFRRQIPLGTGEDWKLYNRAFIGLSYKI